MKKVRFVILALCLLMAFAACAPSGAESGSAVSEPAAPESSAGEKTEELAEGYSLEKIGLEIALPEKIDAYPFQDHSPYLSVISGNSARELRKELQETNPSFGSSEMNPNSVEINFEGSWSCARVTWRVPQGFSSHVPVMLLQAYKKSDIDGGKKVLYETLDHEDICLKLTKFDLMKYLWKETDEYYIVDFLDIYVADYRIFACETALEAIDEAEEGYFSEEHPKGMDFDAYIANIKNIRDEIKAGADIK